MSIFNGDQPTTPTTQNDPSELLNALVGEGKKYKSAEELAKAYISADGFIEQLKAENNELRSKSVQSRTIDEVLERLTQTQQAGVADPTPRQETTQSMSAEEIAKIVENTVSGREAARAKQANLLEADRLMKGAFGEKAGEVFASKATNEKLKSVYMELAATSPQEFLKLFVDVPKNVGIESGGVNTNARLVGTPDRKVQEGTKEYYDNIRRTNPSLYYSQEFQIKMDRKVRTDPALYFGR